MYYLKSTCMFTLYYETNNIIKYDVGLVFITFLCDCGGILYWTDTP